MGRAGNGRGQGTSPYTQARRDAQCAAGGRIDMDDEVEALFPIPLMRSPQLLDPVLIEAAVAAIRGGRVEPNLRSDQLFHTEIANPHDNPVFRRMAQVAVPKLVEFGVLLFG